MENNSVVDCGNGSKVRVIRLAEEGTTVLQFSRPLKKTDVTDGEVLQVAKSYEYEGTLVTEICISQAAKRALHRIFELEFRPVTAPTPVGSAV